MKKLLITLANSLDKLSLYKEADYVDMLSGGIGDEYTPSDFNEKALAKGISVELEHTKNEQVAREIAMDHLTEDPKYYDKLELIESH